MRCCSASGRFDAIVSQPSHPWAGGAAHLYTHEFFELVSRRLAPGGVFVQWIGLPFVDEELFRSLLASLSDVFPHVQAYVPPPTGLGVVPRFERADRHGAQRPAGARRDARVVRAAGIDARGGRDEQPAARRGWGPRARARRPVNRDGHNLLQSRSGRLSIEESLTRGVVDLIAPVDPLVRTLPDGTDVFALLRRLPAARAKRVVASLPDPLDREIGEALVEIEQGKRIGPRRKLAEALARDPDHVEGRAALLRLSAGSIARGAAAEEIVRPPLSDAERAVAAGWVAQARDPSGEACWLSIHSSPRFRSSIRSESKRCGCGSGHAWPAATRRAWTRPSRWPRTGSATDATPSSILLRAEASAAAGDHLALLETLNALIDELDPREPLDARAGATEPASCDARHPTIPTCARFAHRLCGAWTA